MLSAEFVSNTALRKECSNLNKCGVLKEEIKPILGATRDDLYKKFIDGIESIPEGSEDEKKFPASVINFYNEIVDGEDPSDAEKAEIAKKKAAKK